LITLLTEDSQHLFLCCHHPTMSAQALCFRLSHWNVHLFIWSDLVATISHEWREHIDDRLHSGGQRWRSQQAIEV